MGDFKYDIGPIEFKGNPKHMTGDDFHYSSIPKQLIVHGDTEICDSRNINIVGTYGEYYLVKYKAKGSKQRFTTLGFEESFLVPVLGTVMRNKSVDCYSII